MKAHLQHVSVPRPPGEESRKKAVAYYSGLLGLEEKPVPITIQHLDLVWFKLGEEAELHVFAEDPIHDLSQRHFCLAVSDVEAMRQKLTGAGYEVWTPAEIRGRPRFFTRDPFQNIIEMTTIQDDYMKFQG